MGWGQPCFGWQPCVVEREWSGEWTRGPRWATRAVFIGMGGGGEGGWGGLGEGRSRCHVRERIVVEGGGRGGSRCPLTQRTFSWKRFPHTCIIESIGDLLR